MRLKPPLNFATSGKYRIGNMEVDFINQLCAAIVRYMDGNAPTTLSGVTFNIGVESFRRMMIGLPF